MGFFRSIGEMTVRRLDDDRESLSLLGESVVSALSALVHPRQFRFGDFALAFQRASYGGLPITIGIGFLLGVILAFQTAAVLKSFGVETYVSNMLAIALFRELGPIITAVILAGRTGSSFAAEIGTMKVNEELDALTTMGLPPIRFLVLPRVAAAICAMPILTIFADLFGLVGGAIVLQMMGVPTVVFWRGAANSTTVYMILEGLTKGALFGLLVGLIGCLAGVRTKSSADGVGRATTSAVVWGIVAITVTDGLLAVITYVWGLGMNIKL
mgnify:CR=1 FL=1